MDIKELSLVQVTRFVLEKKGGSCLFTKSYIEGFNAQFKVPVFEINLGRINDTFEDGEIVSKKTLMEKGFPMRRMGRI